MPTIERRYEAACAALQEIAGFARRLALAMAAHDAETKKVLQRLSRDHIAAAFRVGGSDDTVKAILDELDKAIEAAVRARKDELADCQTSDRAQRNRGTGANTANRKVEKFVIKMTKED